jgi:hypothetical protein
MVTYKETPQLNPAPAYYDLQSNIAQENCTSDCFAGRWQPVFPWLAGKWYNYVWRPVQWVNNSRHTRGLLQTCASRIYNASDPACSNPDTATLLNYDTAALAKVFAASIAENFNYQARSAVKCTIIPRVDALTRVVCSCFLSREDGDLDSRCNSTVVNSVAISRICTSMTLVVLSTSSEVVEFVDGSYRAPVEGCRDVELFISRPFGAFSSTEKSISFSSTLLAYTSNPPDYAYKNEKYGVVGYAQSAAIRVAAPLNNLEASINNAVYNTTNYFLTQVENGVDQATISAQSCIDAVQKQYNINYTGPQILASTVNIEQVRPRLKEEDAEDLNQEAYRNYTTASGVPVFYDLTICLSPGEVDTSLLAEDYELFWDLGAYQEPEDDSAPLIFMTNATIRNRIVEGSKLVCGFLPLVNSSWSYLLIQRVGSEYYYEIED